MADSYSSSSSHKMIDLTDSSIVFPALTRKLTLVKGKEKFIFEYEFGKESDMIDLFVEMVNNRDLNFDWFDAAVLSHQLGRNFGKEFVCKLPERKD